MFYIENEERDIETITLKEFEKSCHVELVQENTSGTMQLSTVNVNRPGLLLAGFEDYFGDKRIQVIGNAESWYLESVSKEEKKQKLISLFKRKIPCVILTRGIEPCDIIKQVAKEYDVPLFKSDMNTSQLVNELVNYLNNLLALSTSMHGVLLEVSGLGVLITGNSGMGKSETAMELVHRGHRLVADDNVVLKKIQGSIIGNAPEKIRHFMEIRGIGIINVQSMFGVGSVLNKKEVNLVIELKPWSDDIEYDRLGMYDKYENILGIDIPKLTMPVMPGRNLAIVVEVAARNQRLKKHGINATQQLLDSINFGN